MLNLTEKELKEFDKWKEDFERELAIREETIKLVKPEDYQADKLYMKLVEVGRNLAGFMVEKEYACFSNAPQIENDRAFGLELGRWMRRIDEIMEDEYADVLAERLGDLLIVFGI